MKIDFSHRQFAHCESGVTANLLNHHGFPCSEAMAFGIGAGLFFAYAPFIKINYLPLTTYRTAPGSIFKIATKRLGIQHTFTRIRRPQTNGKAERFIRTAMTEWGYIRHETSSDRDQALPAWLGRSALL